MEKVSHFAFKGYTIDSIAREAAEGVDEILEVEFDCQEAEKMRTELSMTFSPL